jgi:hypothetical protein
MTSAPTPTVRNMIVCEEIITDPRNSNRVSLVNLINSIRSLSQPRFPVRFPLFCIFVQMSECRGKHTLRIEVRVADTDMIILGTTLSEVSFPKAPLLVHGVRFRIRNCTFPAAGLYWVQLWVDDHMLAQQPLVLR